MALYVILNFEDPDATYQGGAIAPHISRKTTNLPANVRGSAQATVKGTIAKIRTKETFFKRNKVHHYSCVEIAQADKAGTLQIADVDPIRADCRNAAKIYIIMHGKPDDTDSGFSNLIQGQQIDFTWQQLGRLALLLFPAGDVTYRINLIMCYGARTTSFRMNQNGQLSPGELKSSFAYKFFRSICNYRNVQMVAATGAVSTQDDGTNEVETEEWVTAVLDMIDYKKDTATRQSQEQQFQIYKSNWTGGKQAWDDLCTKYATNANEPTGNDGLRIFLKSYFYQKVHRKDALLAQKAQAGQLHGGASNLAKYGRILYTYDGPGQLRIVNKYGDATNGGVAANYVLYNGPLL